MQTHQWQLQATDGTMVEFGQEFQNFAQILEDKDIEEFVQVQIEKSTLLLIKKFCDRHDYQKDSIKVSMPLKSAIFKENIDPRSFEIFKDLHGIANVEKIKVILEAAYFLNFSELKDCCFCALASDLFVGNKEEDLQKFTKQHRMAELSPAEEYAIMVEYDQIFKQLNKKLRDDVQTDEERYKEIQDDQQQIQQLQAQQQEQEEDDQEF